MFEKECRILRVAPDADAQTIMKAWERMVRRYPPEQFPERFTAVQAARDALLLEETAVSDFTRQCAKADGPLDVATMLIGNGETKAPAFPDLAGAMEKAGRAASVNAIIDSVSAGVEKHYKKIQAEG